MSLKSKNPIHVKLPLLLTLYLREHDVLRLPGIGNFHCNGVLASPDPETAPLNIRFEYAVVREADDSLIDFIKQKTGKMKPLAIADLSSYIESGIQLLNIGKPFYIDGIGTIQRTKDGKHDFVARELAISNFDEPMKEMPVLPSLAARQTDKKRSVFEDEKYQPGVNPWQKLIVAALILGGLAIVVFGGYYLYTNTGGANNTGQNEIPVTDSTTRKQDSLIVPPDSSKSVSSYASLQPGTYKFILETTPNKKRAMRRFSQLKSYMLDIKMDVPADSSSYKLYFAIPATPADTTRIKDSLTRYYLNKVRIEL